MQKIPVVCGSLRVVAMSMTISGGFLRFRMEIPWNKKPKKPSSSAISSNSAFLSCSSTEPIICRRARIPSDFSKHSNTRN